MTVMVNRRGFLV